jgi:hypothetical protein
MVALPSETPETSPALLTVATDVLLLLQSPPVPEVLSVVVLLTHTAAVPDIVPASGLALIVTALVATSEPQPLVTVYDMSTEPAAMPLTTPAADIVATEGSELSQVPPLVVLLSVMLLPVQTTDGPLMVPAAGSGLTVTSIVAFAVPQLPDTV